MDGQRGGWEATGRSRATRRTGGPGGGNGGELGQEDGGTREDVGKTGRRAIKSANIPLCISSGLMFFRSSV